MERFYRIALPIMLLPILFAASLAGWRVDFFQVFDKNGDRLFSSPAALGNRFRTRYIHSVELTPVEDDYIIVGGKLWSWEERVRSSKAGMPSSVPEQGKFIFTNEWMIYQGGRISWNNYFYRIGDKRFGLNQASFEPFGRKNIYSLFPQQCLKVTITKAPYLYKGIFRNSILKKAPADAPAVVKHDRL